jgi:hypothetical protein
MELKAMSVTEYHELTDISNQAITKAMRNGRELPHIDRYEKVGNTYILYTSKKIKKKKLNNLVVN